jgi:hypothetical protein
MTTRTIKQTGQAFGSSPTIISAKINGAEVYNGPVSTLHEPMRRYNNPDEVFPELFSWTTDTNFAGTQQMEIAVSNGQLVIADTVSNYTFSSPSNKSDVFGPVYVNVVPGEAGNVIYTDAITAISINGVFQEHALTNGALGQTYWPLESGDVFTCTVKITASPLIPPPV